ncbi:chaperonin GroEL [Candidatus Pacearchaeota archaeon]|nr:chaperonin GroEL [Candidatus Pacearchaeota archaeon]
MSENNVFGKNFKQEVSNSVKELVEMVSSTMGPFGRTILIGSGKEEIPFSTKDGVTVARHFSYNGIAGNAGAKLIKQAAERSNSIAGDGTTTATVLAGSIYDLAEKSINSVGYKVLLKELKEGMDFIINEIESKLKTKYVKDITSFQDIQDVAIISGNSKDIGTIVATAIEKSGKDGTISVEKSNTTETVIDFVEGFKFKGTYLSSRFCTDQQRKLIKYNEPLIFVTDETISAIEDLFPVLEIAARHKKPLLIVAGDVIEQALAGLIANAMNGSMKVAAVKLNSYGEYKEDILEDLAIATGATFFSKSNMNMGLGKELFKNVSLKDFGKASRIEISSLFSLIVGGEGNEEKIEERKNFIKDLLQQTESEYLSEHLQERFTRLNSGVILIKVGGVTEGEVTEKRYRIEDAIGAVMSAQEQGIVPGGGIFLYKISQEISRYKMNKKHSKSFILGMNILLDAMKAPFSKILENGGYSVEYISEKIQKEYSNSKHLNYGFDIERNEFVDMFKQGIVDPYKVVYVALVNAVSAALQLINVAGFIEISNEKS